MAGALPGAPAKGRGEEREGRASRRGGEAKPWRERRRPPHIKASSAFREDAIRSPHEKGAFRLLSRSYADQIRRKAMHPRNASIAITQAYQSAKGARSPIRRSAKRSKLLVNRYSLPPLIPRFSDRQTVLIRNQNIRNANVKNCYEMLQNVKNCECYEMLRNVKKCYEMLQNVNVKKCYEMLRNVKKCNYAPMPICAYHHIVISRYHFIRICR